MRSRNPAWPCGSAQRAAPRASRAPLSPAQLLPRSTLTDHVPTALPPAPQRRCPCTFTPHICSRTPRPLSSSSVRCARCACCLLLLRPSHAPPLPLLLLSSSPRPVAAAGLAAPYAPGPPPASPSLPLPALPPECPHQCGPPMPSTDFSAPPLPSPVAQTTRRPSPTPTL